MRVRVAICSVVAAACGRVSDRPIDGFELVAEDAVVITGSATTITVSTVATGTNPPDRIDIAAAGLPAGVTAQPVAIPIGGTAEVTLSATAGAAQGAVTIQLEGSAGDLHAATELRLLVRGPAGTIDPTFGGTGRAGGADQMGAMAALAADAQGRIASCANVASAMRIRRFTASGAVDPSFSTQGLFARGGTCLDMIARGDELVVLLSAGTDPQVFALDAAGQAGPPRDLPRPASTSTQATQLALAPDGDVLVVGTITGGSGVPTRAGVWRFDADLAPVAGFTDGSFGLAGFATITSAPYADAFGADAIVRADGSIAILVYTPDGQVLSIYELSATGAPMPDPVYPEFGLASMTQHTVRLASLPDERMVLAGGAGDTGMAITIGNSHFTTADGIALADAGGRPAVAHDVIRHPRNGIVVAGTSRGQLAWRHLDNNEVHDTNFAGALTDTTSNAIARIVALPGGGFAASGGAPVGHVIIRLWD
jgi:hypothetical protein